MSSRSTILARTALLSMVVLGCGSDDKPVTTAPGTDTRTEQEKETESLLEKSQKDYNKKFGK